VTRTETYRADIDGLRALAVLAVIAYHAFPGIAPGGFVGVDVFFVISGFLISSILVEAHRKGTFSFREFYARRIRRLFPSLMIVLLACWVAGWFVLFPAEYKSLGKHFLSGAGFSSNLLFWRDASYFDSASEVKPLLHLWSLGVEEQFYLAWPLVLLVGARLKRLASMIALVLAGSLALCIVRTSHDATAAFFSPVTRAWEFMLGAALAHERVMLAELPRRARTAIGLLGIALVVGSIGWMSRGLPYPGWRAAIPTVGTALVILSGPDGAVASVLSSRLLVGMGLISYPLYLWHWPLLAYARTIEDAEIAVAVRCVLIAASFGLATVCYRFVELPLRSRARARTKTLALLALGGAVVALGAVTYATDLVSPRMASRASEIDDAEQAAARTPVEACGNDDRLVGKAAAFCHRLGDAKLPAIVIWGDSHADAWTPVLFDLATERHAAVFVFSHPGCPPLLHVRRSDGVQNGASCAEIGYAEDVVASIRNLRPKGVFVIARWSLYANGWIAGGRLQAATHFLTTGDGAATLETSRAALAEQLPRTVDALRAVTPNVVVFKSLPVLKRFSNRSPVVRNLAIEPTLDEHRALERFSDAVIDPLGKAAAIRVFDPSTYTCGDTCASFINGVPLYIDDNHVSARGSFQLRDKIAPVFP
jgi:peptidoglycan/LPS O-acetylase OafA/YrhL